LGEAYESKGDQKAQAKENVSKRDAQVLKHRRVPDQRAYKGGNDGCKRTYPLSSVRATCLALVFSGSTPSSARLRISSLADSAIVSVESGRTSDRSLSVCLNTSINDRTAALWPQAMEAIQMQKAHLYEAILLVNRGVDEAVRGLERLTGARAGR
jgi:hypothetical protein